MKCFFSCILVVVSLTIQAQDKMKDSLPYAEIPEASENYTPGTVVARMIDGLGFRYRWVSEGLTEKDMEYRPSSEGRSIRQTLDHLYGLSNIIVNCAKKIPTEGTNKAKEMTTVEKREATLYNFKRASELFAKTNDLEAHLVIFKRGNTESEFPLWNIINGPIEDAVWHTGQIAVLRRSAGNPINSKVNVFSGKLNE